MEKTTINDSFNTTHIPMTEQARLLEKRNALEEKINQLKDLCDRIDPYIELSNEIKGELEDFHISPSHDPYTITNKLIVLLEDSIVRLNEVNAALN